MAAIVEHSRIGACFEAHLLLLTVATFKASAAFRMIFPATKTFCEGTHAAICGWVLFGAALRLQNGLVGNPPAATWHASGSVTAHRGDRHFLSPAGVNFFVSVLVGQRVAVLLRFALCCRGTGTDASTLHLAAPNCGSKRTRCEFVFETAAVYWLPRSEAEQIIYPRSFMDRPRMLIIKYRCVWISSSAARNAVRQTVLTVIRAGRRLRRAANGICHCRLFLQADTIARSMRIRSRSGDRCAWLKCGVFGAAVFHVAVTTKIVSLRSF